MSKEKRLYDPAVLLASPKSLYWSDIVAFRAILLERDGPDCFFCAEPLYSKGEWRKDATVEHLLNKRLARTYERGAGARTVRLIDDPRNCVMACEGCNKDIRTMESIAAKMRYRDRLRSKRLARTAAA